MNNGDKIEFNVIKDILNSLIEAVDFGDPRLVRLVSLFANDVLSDDDRDELIELAEAAISICDEIIMRISSAKE